ELNAKAVGTYLRLGFVPGWQCIHPGVHKLPPATWLTWDAQSSALSGPTRYWRTPVDYDESLSETACLDRIEELLWDATRIRLRSDVPLGVFLSGGIDSSLIATAAAKHASQTLTSLTISVPDWQDDEWPVAR